MKCDNVNMCVPFRCVCVVSIEYYVIVVIHVAHQTFMFVVQISPTNMLSRPSAGMRNNTLIINMPGDSSAFVECLDALMPALPHGLKQLRGEVEMNHPRHVPHGGLNSGCGCDH